MSAKKRLLIKLFIYAALVFAFLYFFKVRVVHDNNMYPTIRDGDFVLVSVKSRPLIDTMVLYTTEDGIEHIGRIKAQGGDEVAITEANGLQVNGNTIYETVPYTTYPGDTLSYPYKIEEDSVFILSDYRENETDSRTYGQIPLKNISGVVVFQMRYRQA